MQPSYEKVQILKDLYPSIANLFSIWQYWTLVLYYVMAEFWVGVMVSLLFWQFANEITRSSEAKRFYAMFALIGHLGPAVSAKILQVVARYFIKNQENVDDCNEFLVTVMIWLRSLPFYLCS